MSRSSVTSHALKSLVDRPDVERRIGPFQLLKPLGRGGQAPVWLAREIYGDTEVRLAAVKLFSIKRKDRKAPTGERIPRTELHQLRVVEEVKALCRVEHPSVARFYSIASDDAGSILGVGMEYLAGQSVEDRLAKGAFPIDDVLAIGASIASALSAVHRAGIVHRDVKPANIVDANGTAKLIDFGIAWEDAPEVEPMSVLVDDLPLEIDDEQSGVSLAHSLRPLALTSTGSVTRSGGRSQSGTHGYMDPACLASGSRANALSDIYALGVVLFECATGKHPGAASVRAGDGLDDEVLSGRSAAPKLAAIDAKLPTSFCQLVDKMLDASPKRRPQTADWIAIELERIRADVRGQRRKLPPESVGPFRGLGRFEADDRDVYFGRSIEIAATLELLRTHGLVTLVGASGSGKSSLARAGVLPRVGEGSLGRGFAAWDVAIASPGHDPRTAIVQALAALEPPLAIRADETPDGVVERLAERAQSTGRGAILFVDQLEELVTQSAPDSASRAWATELLGALSRTSVAGVRALTTVRRDLLDALLGLDGLGKSLVRGAMLVDPMSDAAWLDVIQQALAAYGYALEGQSVETELARQLKGAGSAMPLVQFALTELWHKRDTEKKRIGLEGLDAIGGISGSLERHADATLAKLGRETPGAEPIAREILVALTTPQGTRETRAAEDLVRGADGSADPARRAILDGLERARLVVAGPEGVTLAHESLLGEWKRLAGWLAEVRDERVLVAELERDAAAWAKDPARSLWQHRRLARAMDLLRGTSVLREDAKRFLAASRARERRARVVAFAVAIVIATLGVAGAAIYIRSVRQSELAANERASLEQSKAEGERAQRLELEQAQADLRDRQRQVDELMVQLANAKDPTEFDDVKKKLEKAHEDSVAAQARVDAIPKPTTTAVAARPSAPPATTPATTTPTVTTRGPKLQDGDD